MQWREWRQRLQQRSQAWKQQLLQLLLLLRQPKQQLRRQQLHCPPLQRLQLQSPEAPWQLQQQPPHCERQLLPCWR